MFMLLEVKSNTLLFLGVYTLTHFSSWNDLSAPKYPVIFRSLQPMLKTVSMIKYTTLLLYSLCVAMWLSLGSEICLPERGWNPWPSAWWSDAVPTGLSGQSIQSIRKLVLWQTSTLCCENFWKNNRRHDFDPLSLKCLQEYWAFSRLFIKGFEGFLSRTCNTDCQPLACTETTSYKLLVLSIFFYEYLLVLFHWNLNFNFE